MVHTFARAARFVVAGLTVVVVSAACGGGGGGSKPVIASFSSSPASLPSGGGQVTFSWSVQHAATLDIEPQVGAVTGTSATVTITTGGTFTLTATNSHGSATATTPIVVGAAITVSGRVFEFGPSAGVPVVVLGQPDAAVAITDTDGRFTIDGVVPPYDIAFVSRSGNATIVYRGLSRPDPTLSGVLTGPFALAQFGASQPGTLAGGTGFPEAGGLSTEVSAYTPFGYGNQTPASTSDGSWMLPVNWSGHVTTPVMLHAVEYASGANGPTSFLRAGSATTQITAGGSLPSVNIPMTPVPATQQVSGTIATPPGYQAPYVHLGISWTQGGSILDTESMTLPGYTSSVGNFTLATPAIPGTTVDVLASSIDPVSNGFVRYGHNFIAPSTTGLALSLPPAPRQLFPSADAQVDYQTLFAWTNPDEAVSQLVLIPSTASSQGLVIVQQTHGPASTTIPKIQETGFALLPGQNYAWGIGSYGPFSSIDDAAGPSGLFGHSGPDAFVGQTPQLSFDTRSDL